MKISTIFEQSEMAEKRALKSARAKNDMQRKKIREGIKRLRRKIIEKPPTSARSMFFEKSIDRVRADLASKGSKGASATKAIVAQQLIVEWSSLGESDVKFWEDKTQELLPARINTFKAEMNDLINEH